MAFRCARFSGNPDVVKAGNNAPPFQTGSKGEGVRVLQMALIDLGFAMPRSTAGGTALPDGIFGSETAATVAAFQRANGLVADAVAGRMTLARLDTLTAAKMDQSARMGPMMGNKAKGLG